MPLEIQPVTTADAVDITNVQSKAFSTDFDKALFPDTPEQRKWSLEMTEDKIRKAEVNGSAYTCLKVVDQLDYDEDQNTRDTEIETHSGNLEQQQQKKKQSRGTIAGFVLMKLFTPEESDEPGSGLWEKDELFWPECSNRGLCALFFGDMVGNRKKHMSGRPYFYLDILAVSPEYQGRGCASRLLKPCLSRADEQGLEIYLSASPRGRPVYEKFGFQAVETKQYGDFIQTCMIRPSRREVK